MRVHFAPSPIKDTLSFRADWAGGIPQSEIGSKYGVQGRTVMRRAMTFGYPRRDRNNHILGPMPARAAIDDGSPAPIEQVEAPKVEQTHPRWPAEYDLAILNTDGKYSRIANLSKSLGRSVNAILGRWHQLRAG